ncbi:hypothetical protein ABH935_005852 [Catenulispora sp. GAS73]|uniref:hypothetical protein n=1 Tax=Catenulispora sp. GAS73 TaxID=3156269 RepID=UPI003513C42F
MDLDSTRVDFDAEWFRGDEPELIVTIDPNVPSRYEATDMMSGIGSAPAATLLQLVGDERMPDLITYLPRGRQAAEEWWPKARRIYEYYLEEDWVRFNKAGRSMLGDSWSDPATTHERATAAHQVLGIVLKAITDDDDPAASNFLRRWLKKHTGALNRTSYRAFARADADSGELAVMQRRLFDVLDLFIQRFDSWQMGILRRIVPDQRLPLLGDLTLFRDEFDILRDLYQQAFETVCKTLRYPVAAQNTIKRGDPSDFGGVVPQTLTRKANPKDLAAFEKLVNYEKLQYVAQIPGMEGWVGLLDNKTRNAIGHATVRHDLRTGLVVSDTLPAGVHYLDVASDVFGIFDALCISLQVLRGIRIVSSPDFGKETNDVEASVRRALGLPSS